MLIGRPPPHGCFKICKSLSPSSSALANGQFWSNQCVADKERAGHDLIRIRVGNCTVPVAGRCR